MKPRDRPAVQSLGDPRDDAADADADMPMPAKALPKGEMQSDLPDPFPEELRQGEGPDLSDKDQGAGLGPPSGPEPPDEHGNHT